MANPILTHRWLDRALTAQAVRAVFVSRTGRSLVLLWLLGVGALAVAFKAPALALVLTLVLGGAAIGLAHGLVARPVSRSRILAWVLQRELPCGRLDRGPLRQRVEGSRVVFLELSARAHSPAAAGGSRSELERVLDTAGATLRVQYEAARQAQDHLRVLRLVQPTHPSAAALHRLAREESRLVEEAGATLEALLVLLLQLGPGPGELVGIERRAEERAETLDYLQARVEAQQQTAAELHRSMRIRA